MPDEPQIKLLSKQRRRYLFISLVTVFLIALPAMIFYTTGYRINFGSESTIVTTGGMYVTNNNLEVDVYLDDQRVDKPRLFRSAYYIQNIESGQHRIVVQRPDLQTWVKELPIDPRIVIEVASFNMPTVPHIRPISQFVDGAGMSLYTDVPEGINMFPKATTTEPFYATSTILSLNYQINEEFNYIGSLFSTTSTTTLSVFDRFLEGVERFRFATTSETESTTTIEEVIERGDMTLREIGNDIYAVWSGNLRDIPYYFCVPEASTTTIANRYGEHVAEAIAQMSKSTTTPIMLDGDRICRSQIKLNRLRQDVYFYDFFPNSSDLVLLQLEDGLYVTEIDDRAWQNTQLLYPGDDFKVVVENDSIYIKEDKYYFELITEIEPN